MVADSTDSRRPRRDYDSPLRRERAERTRAHVIATAAGLFAEHGYAATSMRRIAAEAGVGLETVTQTGRKADLLLAAFRAEFTGSPAAIDLSTLIGLPSADDLRETLESAVAAVAERLRRSRGIWHAFTVAATADETVAAVRRDLAAARRRDVTAWLTRCEEEGTVAPNTDAARARLADEISLLVSHDSYDHLTGVCGWPHEDYAPWAAAAVLNQLRGADPAC